MAQENFQYTKPNLNTPKSKKVLFMFIPFGLIVFFALSLMLQNFKKSTLYKNWRLNYHTWQEKRKRARKLALESKKSPLTDSKPIFLEFDLTTSRSREEKSRGNRQTKEAF